MSDVAEKLRDFSKDTGIPEQELRQLCLRVGLGQLLKGEIKIGPEVPSDKGYVVLDLRELSKEDQEKVQARAKAQRVTVAAWIERVFQGRKEVLT